MTLISFSCLHLHAVSNPTDEFGEAWVHEWLLWKDGGAFADPDNVLRFKKTAKRAKNYRWYFGCDPPNEHQTKPSAIATRTIRELILDSAQVIENLAKGPWQ